MPHLKTCKRDLSLGISSYQSIQKCSVQTQRLRTFKKKMKNHLLLPLVMSGFDSCFCVHILNKTQEITEKTTLM